LLARGYGCRAVIAADTKKGLRMGFDFSWRIVNGNHAAPQGATNNNPNQLMARIIKAA
jgi:hypothetical protein